MEYLLYIGISLLVAWLLIIFLTDPPVVVKAHWQHFFDGQEILPDEFYAEVGKELKARKIRIGVTHPDLKETHILSSSRKYQRLADGDQVIYLCVAPFGTGTFVSWRYCETEEGLMARIPGLSRAIGKDRKHKTFFQLDTEGMYKTVIHTTILSAIDKFGNTHGMRELNPLERQFKEVS